MPNSTCVCMLSLFFQLTCSLQRLMRFGTYRVEEVVLGHVTHIVLSSDYSGMLYCPGSKPGASPLQSPFTGFLAFNVAIGFEPMRDFTCVVTSYKTTCNSHE